MIFENHAHSQSHQILIEFLGTKSEKLPSPVPIGLIEDVHNTDEKTAAKNIRTRLKFYGIDIKHTHALDLVGKLLGRNGRHGQPEKAATPEITLHFLNQYGQALDSKSADMSKIVELAASLLKKELQSTPEFLIGRLNRSNKEILLWFSSVTSQAGATLLIQWDTESDMDRSAQINRACERLRRLIEETGSGFCVGIFEDDYPFDHSPGSLTELVACVDGAQIARGNEYTLFEQMEAYVKGSCVAGMPENSSLTVNNITFELSLVNQRMVPMVYKRRPLFPPEVFRLYSRYRRLKMAIKTSLAEYRAERQLSLELMPLPNVGMPSEVEVDWDQVSTGVEALGITLDELSGKVEFDCLAMLTEKPFSIGISEFMQLADAVSHDDFNRLVRKPSFSECSDLSREEDLRNYLHVTDGVKAVLGRGFSDHDKAVVKECLTDLIESENMKTFLAVNPSTLPMHIVYTNAAEFLSSLDLEKVSVRGKIIPNFTHSDLLKVPDEIQAVLSSIGADTRIKPAVGRFLHLIVSPKS